VSGLSKKKNTFNQDFELKVALKKLWKYKIPEREINNILRFQIQKFGLRLDKNILRMGYDENGKPRNYKKRRH